jgi:thiamine biosynthesis lipoprotein
MKLGFKRLIIYAIFGILAAVVISIALSGCAKKPVQQESFAMDTIITQTIYGSEDILAQANEKISGIEAALSKTIPDSDISKINHAGGMDTEVSDMTVQVINAALEAARKTDGAFSPALGALMYQWGFGTEVQLPPSQANIERALGSSDYNDIHVNENIVNAGNAQIDLGGIAKGYALDEIKQVLDSGGVEDALIVLGGSVYARGAKPDGEAWTVGVRDPFAESADYSCTLELKDECVSTSGIYERGFEYEGVYYHHILDPATGMPVNNGLVSVSVVSESGIDTDIYSTALFVMGLENGKKFAQENGLGAIFITSDQKIYLTEGFGHGFALTNTDYEVQ